MTENASTFTYTYIHVLVLNFCKFGCGHVRLMAILNITISVSQ